VITINHNDDADVAFISDNFSQDDAEQIGTMIAMLSCGMYNDVFLKSIQKLFSHDQYKEFSETVFKTWKEEETEIHTALFSFENQGNYNEEDEEEPMVRPDDLPYAPPLPGDTSHE
jgi:hypothetical protein